MDSTLSGSSILTLSAWCTVRPQQKQVVVYNSRTDELHLVPLPGFYIIQLCDGLNTVAELEQFCSEATRSGDGPVHETLLAFLEKLVHRGVLKVANAAGG
jgi:hypothetical protein